MRSETQVQYGERLIVAMRHVYAAAQALACATSSVATGQDPAGFERTALLAMEEAEAVLRRREPGDAP
ncbi:MAG: hypothetical protein IT437_07270 [Phycisphaerales bacterium]|nr:hypothetical protein [Phycisphaerales bacterium]